VNLSAATLRKMLEFGLTAEQMVELAETMDAGRSGGAERQARYREKKKAEKHGDVTRDVTGDASLPLEEKVSPRPPSKTQSPYTPSPPKGGSVPKIIPFAKPNGFERFWEACPRKVGKGAARKAFDRALAKIGSDDPLAVLLAALERVKPTWTDLQYAPHPATWLNEERWEDEPEIPPPKARDEDEYAAVRRQIVERMSGNDAANHG